MTVIVDRSTRRGTKTWHLRDPANDSGRDGPGSNGRVEPLPGFDRPEPNPDDAAGFDGEDDPSPADYWQGPDFEDDPED